MCGFTVLLHEPHIVIESATFTIPHHRKPRLVIRSENGGQGDPMRLSTTEYNFPYEDSGFQFEARHVHECLRKGLKTSPRVAPKETTTLMRICDTVRKQINLVYPWEV